MKKVATLFSLFLLPLLIFGQARQSIDFVGGVEYANATKGPSFAPGQCNTLDTDFERAVVNWRFGANYNRQLSNKFWLRSGLRLASSGYETSYVSIFDYGSGWGDILDGLNYGGNSNPCSSIQIIETPISVDFLLMEIPLVVRYEANQKKFAPYFELGLSPSFYLSAEEEIERADGTRFRSSYLDSDNFNRFNLVGLVAFGFNYTLSDNWQLFGQPTFRYHFTQIFDSSNSRNLYNYGLEMGVRKQL